MKLRLNVTPVYTVLGIKLLYQLCDAADGKHLIYLNNIPVYYFNIFDEMYKDIIISFNGNPETHLSRKLKSHPEKFTLRPSICGLRSSKLRHRWFYLDKLPVSFLG